MPLLDQAPENPPMKPPKMPHPSLTARVAATIRSWEECFIGNSLRELATVEKRSEKDNKAAVSGTEKAHRMRSAHSGAQSDIRLETEFLHIAVVEVLIL